MPDLSSLYPAPPQQNQGLLNGDPSRAIGALQAIQSYALQQQQFPALARQPAASLQGTEIENKTRMIQQQAEARKLIASAYGTGIAGMANPKEDDIHNLTALIARSHPEIAQTYPGIINGTSDFVLKHPQGIKYGGGLLLNMGLSPGEASSRVTAPPGPGGEPRVMPVTAANLQGTSATGLAPGEEGALGASAARGSELMATASTSPQLHADLENLKQDSRVLDNLGGPSAEVEKKLNQLSHRVAGVGITMNADQLRAAESFDKIASGITARQASLVGAATDAGRHMILGATPNTSMSRLGRDAMIDMAQGNQDFLDTARTEWSKQRAKGAPANAHDAWMANVFSKGADPRVFQFNRMGRADQKKFLSQMDPEDYPEFREKYDQAMKLKWVKPLKGEDGAPAATAAPAAPVRAPTVATAPSAARVPLPVPKPPIPGARLAPDGEHYINDPYRPGKYIRVRPGENDTEM